MKLSRLNEGVLYEAGLSRILTHSTNPFTILTAFRADYTLAQNRARNRGLEGKLRTIGAGGIKLIGHWLEAPTGQDYNQASPDQLTDVVEESYFISIPSRVTLDQFQEWIINVLNTFDQDAAILSDGNTINLIDKTGELTPIGTGISVDKIQQAYSTIKGKNFVFEGTIRPSSNMHRMLLKKRGITWV